MTDVRVAESSDYPALSALFSEVYKPGHPLFSREFWEWQYGSAEHGRSIVAERDGKFIGHVGAAIGGGIAWIINVYLAPSARGSGLLRKMYDLSRTFAPLAAASINRAGLDMYRNMGWIRYCDLQRFVALNPAIPKESLLQERGISKAWPKPVSTHYWQQPGIVGAQMETGSTAVVQGNVGGLRVMSLVDGEKTAQEAFERGVAWLDFVTSWNDPICRTLDKEGWVHEDNAPIPWRLNPVVEGTRAHIALCSEEPLPKSLIISRDFSDHGRVGSLK